MSAGRANNRRTSGALTVLLVTLLLGAGAGFAGYSVLETKWMELDAQRTQFENLKRRRPAGPSASAELPITVQPFLGEENFALAANALQKRVVGAIEETEGKLVTVSVDPPVTGDEDLARRVSVQVTAELTNEALQKVLYELERGIPFAFIDSFGVTRMEAREAAAAKGEPRSSAPRLQVSMSVTSYRRKGSK